MVDHLCRSTSCNWERAGLGGDARGGDSERRPSTRCTTMEAAAQVSATQEGTHLAWIGALVDRVDHLLEEREVQRLREIQEGFHRSRSKKASARAATRLWSTTATVDFRAPVSRAQRVLARAGGCAAADAVSL